jgi:hypothetical protein
MTTKLNPGKFDCYEKALPSEPMFILLARDPSFGELVRLWVDRRAADIRCGERPESDETIICEALECARQGEDWRKKNNGAWRKPPSLTPTVNVKFSEKVTSDPTITMSVSYQTENVVGFDRAEFEKLVIETFHKAKAQNRL